MIRLFVDNVEPAIVSNKAPFINLGTPKSKENHMWRYLYDDAYNNSFERMVFTWRDAVSRGERILHLILMMIWLKR
jgi:hypothetical protein